MEQPFHRLKKEAELERLKEQGQCLGTNAVIFNVFFCNGRSHQINDFKMSIFSAFWLYLTF